MDRPRIIPHNGIVIRLTRRAIPRNRRFALVGNTRTGQSRAVCFINVDPSFLQGLHDGLNASDRIGPNLEWIVFVPTNLSREQKEARQSEKQTEKETRDNENDNARIP